MTTFLYNLKASSIKIFVLLKLSLTSSAFYKDVYNTYSGTGLKYVFTFSFLGTLIASILILVKLSPVLNYFEDRVVRTPLTASIDQILNQWQPIFYDGISISASEEEPVLLKGTNNKTLVAVDAEDKLPGTIKKNIPLIFGKTKLLFNIQQGEGSQQFSYDYINLLGNSRKEINSEELISLIKNHLKYFDQIYIFLLFPLMVGLNFFALLLEKALTVLILFFAIKMLAKTKQPMKASIRTLAFASGMPALLLPLHFNSLVHIIELWCGFLIFKALTSNFVNMKFKK